MPTSEVHSNFDHLGIDIDSSPMMILKAVMSASGGPSKFVTYKEVAKALQKLEKKKKPYTKAYIYRQLAELKKEGYLVIDQVQKPRRYAISESGILDLLMKKKKIALSELQTKKQEVKTRMKLLEDINPESVAFVAFNQLMGLETVSDSIIIEGIENVRNTVIREFGKASNSGDEIRIMAPISLVGPGRLEQAGMAEMSLLRRAIDGVKILTLTLPSGDLPKITKSFAESFAEYLQNFGQEFMSLASSGNIVVKIAKEEIKTYRMVSLNREKILLYLTHAADSDMAALVHRKDNPGLIDDAVDTFDKISADSVDAIDLVRQEISKKK